MNRFCKEQKTGDFDSPPVLPAHAPQNEQHQNRPGYREATGYNPGSITGSCDNGNPPGKSSVEVLPAHC